MSASPLERTQSVHLPYINYALPEPGKGHEFAADILDVGRGLFAEAVTLGDSNRPKTLRNVTHRTPDGVTILRTSEGSSTDYGLYINGLRRRGSGYNEVSLLHVLDGRLLKLSFSNFPGHENGNASITWHEGSRGEAWGSKLSSTYALDPETDTRRGTYDELIETKREFILGLVGALSTAQAATRDSLVRSKSPVDILDTFARNRAEQHPDIYDPHSQTPSSLAQFANSRFTSPYDRLMEKAFMRANSKNRV